MADLNKTAKADPLDVAASPGAAENTGAPEEEASQVSRQEAAVSSARAQLASDALRLMALLQEWDEDQSGSLDLAELLLLLPALGVQAARPTVEALFLRLCDETGTVQSAKSDALAPLAIEHWDLFRALCGGMAEDIELATESAKQHVAERSSRR